MTLPDVLRLAIEPALSLLPPKMDSREARAMMGAAGLQESRLRHRDQLDPLRLNGPALGLWQFEKGTPETRGGVTGVMLHTATQPILREIAVRLDYEWNATYLWQAIEYDLLLGAVFARLLLWTVPRPLPKRGDYEESWMQYAELSWRPGSPHRETWNAFYDEAWGGVG